VFRDTGLEETVSVRVAVDLSCHFPRDDLLGAGKSSDRSSDTPGVAPTMESSSGISADFFDSSSLTADSRMVTTAPGIKAEIEGSNQFLDVSSLLLLDVEEHQIRLPLPLRCTTWLINALRTL
jgi:hypothetical protein